MTLHTLNFFALKTINRFCYDIGEAKSTMIDFDKVNNITIGESDIMQLTDDIINNALQISGFAARSSWEV